MKFLRRFLAPVLLSSWLLLTIVALVIYGGQGIVANFPQGLSEWAFGTAFVSIFMTLGVFTIGFPCAYFLVRKDVAFRIALPVLIIIGGVGGIAITLIISLLTVEPGTRNGHLDPTIILIGGLAGLISGGVCTAFNADLFAQTANRADDGRLEAE